MRRVILAAAGGVGVVAVGVIAAIALAHPSPGRYDVTSVAPTVVAPAAGVQVEATTTATAAASEANATAQSSSVVVIDPGPAAQGPSSGRVVVSNSGSATANTGGNVGQNVTTGPATAVGNDARVVIK